MKPGFELVVYKTVLKREKKNVAVFLLVMALRTLLKKKRLVELII